MSTESQHEGAKISSDQWEVPGMLLASPGTTTVSTATMAVSCPEERPEPRKENPTMEFDYEDLAIGKYQRLTTVNSVRMTMENGPKLVKDNTAKPHRIIGSHGRF